MLVTPAEQVGAEVRRRRLAIGLSQEELAARAGLHRTYVGSVERGERNLTLSSILKIARALDAPPAALLQNLAGEGQ